MRVCLVLEGGASRGFFTTGVLDYFLEEKIHINHVYGSSMGGINGLSYLARQKYRIFDVMLNTNTRDLIKVSNIFKGKPIVNFDYIIKDIFEKEHPLDLDELNKPGKTCKVSICPVDKPKLVYADLVNNENYIDYIMATAALPPLLSPIKINNVLYFDGGINNPVPYEEAIREFDKVIVIRTQDKDYYKKKSKPNLINYLKFINHKDAYLSLKNKYKIYNKQVDELKELEKAKKVFIIYPINSLKIKRFKNSFEDLLYLYYQGKYSAKYYVREILEYLSEESK